jgi:anaerobic selenocysteine-containing dehydrogenase
VKGLFVYNSNPAAVCPNQSRVHAGLAREDLFMVVHDQFQTDTADFADIILPATSQLEHFDIHSSYGHLYVQSNNPAIAPLGEAKPNTEVFRLLARAMGFETELFEESDEELARRSLRGGPVQEGITLEATKAGPVRLNLPKNWAPFADGKFPTPSGNCELYSEREARAGRDPLPHYIPPHEDPQTKPELAARYPLQLLTPPAAPFLNSTFVNVDALRKAAGERTLEIHPDDAAKRGIADGQEVSVFNARGRFLAKTVLSQSVKPGVVVSRGLLWRKYAVDGVNCNSTTSTATTDLGGGATFFDNLVEVDGT